MNLEVVGISDCKVSSNAESVLTTYALGSCIAVAVYDPESRVAGLLHYMLPESSLDAAKALSNPYIFADSGISQMLKELQKQGANRKRMVVRLAGGAQVVSGPEMFQIGRLNYLAAKKLLWKEGVLIAAQAVGGEVCRTVRLDVATGRTTVREGAGMEKNLTDPQSGTKA